MDLFASRLNAQLEQFVRSERDRDRHIATPMGQVDGIRIPTILSNRQMPQEGQGGESITGTGGTNMEVPALVPCSTGTTNRPPLILPEDPELLMDPFGNPHPLVVAGQLQLAAWKLSGRDSLQQEFQEKLPNCWPLDGAQEQTLHTKCVEEME